MNVYIDQLSEVMDLKFLSAMFEEEKMLETTKIFFLYSDRCMFKSCYDNENRALR